MKNQLTALASNMVEALPYIAFLLDTDHRIIKANQAAQNLFGTELDGKNLSEFMPFPEAFNCIDQAMETGTLLTCSLELTIRTPRTYQASAALIHDALDDGDEKNETLLFTLNDISAEIDAEKSRSIFVANVSHELRSPLTALMGIVETLLGPARNDETARERFLKMMQSETSRMSRLVGDLLSLSKLEAKEHLKPEGAVSIEPLIRQTTLMLGETAREYKNRVTITTQNNLPEVNGSVDELTEVFQNLIENALKYSTPATPVSIQITNKDNHLVVTIQDQSEGIEERHLARLTERFYRIDKGRSRDKGGTGLGLAITKHILNRHDAKFSITSQEGQGSCVTLRFPVG